MRVQFRKIRVGETGQVGRQFELNNLHIPLACLRITKMMGGLKYVT